MEEGLKGSPEKKPGSTESRLFKSRLSKTTGDVLFALQRRSIYVY